MDSAFAIEAGIPATKTKADKLAINLWQRYRGVFSNQKILCYFHKSLGCWHTIFLFSFL